MMKHGVLALLMMALLPLAASAGNVTDVGKTTEKALEMQRSGKGAVEQRPMLKDVAARTYERYLKSFEYPIPERFEERESFNTGK